MALDIFSDLSERLSYNLPGLPLYARRGEPRNFDHYAAACHWHPDLEFVVVQDGAMDYFVNGQTLCLAAGEGIFINSKRLHYGYSKDNKDCSFLCVVVHPGILGQETPAVQEYIEAKFSMETENFIHLTNQTDWKNEAIKSVGLIFAEIQSEMCNPLRLLSQATSLCAYIGENIPHASTRQTDKQIWMSVWSMTGFIQKNYGDKLTLEDIAAAGSVCRSRCCRLFNEYVGQTPIAYLTRYRIGKSCEMLRGSDMSVIEVSLACGFQSPSYFTQVFQKETGLTPRDYRNQSPAG